MPSGKNLGLDLEREVAPGLSMPPSLSVSILTTSEGFGRGFESCAFAARGHASRVVIAIVKTRMANTPGDQQAAPAGP